MSVCTRDMTEGEVLIIAPQHEAVYHGPPVLMFMEFDVCPLISIVTPSLSLSCGEAEK